jgi:NAD+ synthase (glutamine-hydrolysing)
MILGDFGYVRAAAASPRVRVGDTGQNAEETVKLIRDGAGRGVRVMRFRAFVTGYTCADLFNQKKLLTAAERALGDILERTADCDVLAAVGMPVEADNQLFNCAAVFYGGRLLGIVPKTFVPNYNEFYEKRWFAPPRRG